MGGALAEQAPGLYTELVAELSRVGVIAPGDPRLYALADGPVAMRAFASGDTVGNLAIVPSL